LCSAQHNAASVDSRKALVADINAQHAIETQIRNVQGGKSGPDKLESQTFIHAGLSHDALSFMNDVDDILAVYLSK
jgi:hypothetical protein